MVNVDAGVEDGDIEGNRATSIARARTAVLGVDAVDRALEYLWIFGRFWRRCGKLQLAILAHEEHVGVGARGGNTVRSELRGVPLQGVLVHV